MLKNNIIMLIMMSFLGTGTLYASTLTEKDVSRIVEETLKQKPEIIVNALNEYQSQEETKKADSQKEAVKAEHKNIYEDGYSLVIGNPKGDVTLVAFKDYRCGYCKRAWETIKTLLEQDKNLRIILKELPILGTSSRIASTYGLASSAQGKYAEYYEKLISHNGPWDKNTLLNIAGELDLDTKKLEKNAESDKIAKQIDDNLALAHKLGIEGTPAFVIGDRMIPGAIPLETFKELIAEQRASMQKKS